MTDKDRFNVPMLHIGAIDDGKETRYQYQLFNLVRENAVSAAIKDSQYLVVGDFDHGAAIRTNKIDYWGLALKWHNYWLKGLPSDVLSRPKVQYQIHGRPGWVSSEVWPDPRAKARRLFLGSTNSANTAAGDGLLMPEPGANGSDSFIYDPANPVTITVVDAIGSTRNAMGDDMRGMAARTDVLVYRAAPLPTHLDMVGDVDLFLKIRSTAPDTDFTATLVDVRPDGYMAKVQDGVMRARYREGWQKPKLLKNGEIVPLQVKIEAVSYRFEAGHRIALLISSSKFPVWGRNLNTGGDNELETQMAIATNTVAHGADHLSHLSFAVMPTITSESDLDSVTRP